MTNLWLAEEWLLQSHSVLTPSSCDYVTKVQKGLRRWHSI